MGTEDHAIGAQIDEITILNEARLVILNGRASGVFNLALRACAAIAAEHIDVLISQSCSQYDICFAVYPEVVGPTIEVLQRIGLRG